jgi:hypothetical protein
MIPAQEKASAVSAFTITESQGNFLHVFLTHLQKKPMTDPMSTLQNWSRKEEYNLSQLLKITATGMPPCLKGIFLL